MATDQTNTEHGTSQPSGDEGDKEKLFFGKYKSIEEAEAGYKELERGFHTKAEEASRWKEIADNERGGRTELRSENQTQPQPASQQEAQAALTKFYVDPVGTFRSIKEEAAREAEERLTKKSKQETDLRGRIDAWGKKNADLDQYQDFLQLEVSKTDARLTPESRLDEAAKRVRSRLAELRGSRSEDRQPGPNDYVPGPSGNREDGGARTPMNAPTSNPEAELEKLASERNKNRFKRPGRHGR